MSGDGRAGATAPTMTGFQPSDAAVCAALNAWWIAVHVDGAPTVPAPTRDTNPPVFGHAEAMLAAAFPVMLAAWIYRLTPEQLSDLDVACERAMTTEDLRAALTRLGGAHE